MEWGERIRAAIQPGQHTRSENVGHNRAELRGLLDAGVQIFHVDHGGPVSVSSVRARLLRGEGR